jgi:hypothetical protein
MKGPSTRNLAAYHFTEAIRHLSVAIECVRELPDRELSDWAQTVDGMIETIREARGRMDAPPEGIRGRKPKKPDRRAVERRASKRRVDDKRKAALRTAAKRSVPTRSKGPVR